VLHIRKADLYNTSCFSFEWLFLRVWTLDSFNFEIALNISEHWGIGVTAIIPYLRIVICIPFPDSFAMWVQQNLWRQVKREHEKS